MKKLDIFFLVSSLIFTVFLSLTLRFNFLLNSIFFLVIPSVYLSFRNRNVVLRNLIFTLPFAIITGIITDYILLQDKAWFVPTIFPFRILGVTIEEIFWYVSSIYFCITVYEHFQDNKKHNLTDKHLKNLGIALVSFIILFIGLLILSPSLLHISFFYFKLEIILIASCILILLKYKSLLTHLFKVSFYILTVSLIYLLVGVKLGNWVYMGSGFVGWAKILGLLIPYEEIILALILWIFSIEYFEFFDDRKDIAKA